MPRRVVRRLIRSLTLCSAPVRAVGWRAGAVLALALLLGLPTGADAQYFGQNKVQFKTFDFRVLKTEHFDIYYYPEEERAARDAALMAERWYLRLSRVLNHEFDERQPIVFYGSHPAFQQTTTLRGGIGEGTGGVTEAFKQRVIMPLTGSYEETDHVLGHELVHAFQYDISGLGRFGGRIDQGARSFAQAPLWFTEGMAEYLSLGPVDAHTAMWVRDAALRGDLPDIRRLTTDPRIFPYRWGHALWAYVTGRWGDAALGQILRLVGEGVPYPVAFQRVLNVTLDELSQDWHAEIRRTYLPLLADRPEAEQIAAPLITQRGRGGRLNLGPALSPDGRYVAFLSEIDFFDIELWLADAETGEIIKRLQKGSAFDSHFQSLRYINSAGSWSPDGRFFTFAALREGEDVLVILDVDDLDVERRVDIPDVIEITSPSWSADGRTIVFAGIDGGISDLYAYDVETGETRRLTDDVYANLHPEVSPDGRTVAFVTDEGPGTDLGTLQFGGYRLALYDLASGQTTLVPGRGQGNSINPQWTRNGDGLYFVSNRDGVPNVFRVDLASGEVFQLTRLFGGVSGITDISPVLSSTPGADRVLFTAYENNGYNIYALEKEELIGTRVPTTLPGTEEPPFPAVLPPAPRPVEAPFNRVSALLADPELGLPQPTQVAAWEVVPYTPSIELDYIGQPQVGAQLGGAFGGGLYGGVSAAFSDLLGYHNLAGAVQAQGQLDEIGFAVQYLNRKHRWNYGGVAQRIPYVALRRAFFFDPDLELFRNQIRRFRVFNTALQGMAQYPLSVNQRVEANAGFRRLAQDIQVLEVLVDPVTRAGLEQREFDVEGSDQAWNLFEASAALVYDNALFGVTSPFAGQRYRFEATPVVGSINYVQALADYRRYFWRRPFTLAVQGLHFGRYGSEAEDLFSELFLAQPSLVRGYADVYNDCRQTGNCDIETAQQLFGSRVAVLKAEFRFPLIQRLMFGESFGFPPIEGFAFFDAGVAWEGGQSPVFERAGVVESEFDRGILSSAGVGTRINLFGYFIFEIDYVKPLEGDQDWHFQFALQPGF